MNEAIKQYNRDSKEFKSTRKRNGIPLRYMSKLTGVHFNTIFRFEHRKPIGALDYIILCRWTAEENPPPF